MQILLISLIRPMQSKSSGFNLKLNLADIENDLDMSEGEKFLPTYKNIRNSGLLNSFFNAAAWQVALKRIAIFLKPIPLFAIAPLLFGPPITPDHLGGFP